LAKCCCKPREAIFHNYWKCFCGGEIVSLIEKILVALDGSEPADRALVLSLELAVKCSAEIVLFSVVESIVVPAGSSMYPVQPMGVPTIPPEWMIGYSEELKVRHEKVLSEALKKATDFEPSLKVSTRLVEGRPSDRIIEAAKEGKFDMIVMGSRGLGGVKEFFLGSVSDRVADEASCPVLIVK
jgi:nucleotide-binding universal stress UspA family protein